MTDMWPWNKLDTPMDEVLTDEPNPEVWWCIYS